MPDTKSPKFRPIVMVHLPPSPGPPDRHAAVLPTMTTGPAAAAWLLLLGIAATWLSIATVV
jgi:hypothetical protein